MEEKFHITTNESRRETEGYFHVYTNGLSDSLLYRDESDYICGMNDVPICLLMTGAELLCFCLMSNHVHFILRGTEGDCRKFIMEFKRRSGQRLKKKYADIHSISNIAEDTKRIGTEEYLQTAIAYVLRNPMITRGSHCLATTCRWSSGVLYFNDIIDTTGFRKISEFKDNEIRAIFKTRIKIPSDYLVDSNGMIFQGSYINPATVEKIYYRSPSKFIFHLSKTNDGEFERSQNINNYVSYDDLKVKSFMLRICMEEYRCDSFEMLSMLDKNEIGNKLWKRYRVPAKQFARISGIPLRELEKYSWAQSAKRAD